MTAANTKKIAKKSSAKARAGAARLAAVQAVYQQLKNEQTAASVITEYQELRFGKEVDGDEMIVPDAALFSRIVQGVETRRADLEPVIFSFWRKGTEEAKTVDKPADPLLMAVFLCGGFELMAHHDIDAPIVISDYLHVTHAFYDQGESKLVNGILDRLAKSFRDGA